MMAGSLKELGNLGILVSQSCTGDGTASWKHYWMYQHNRFGPLRRGGTKGVFAVCRRADNSKHDMSNSF